jgi:predicted amidohydrolase YtcJ
MNREKDLIDGLSDRHLSEDVTLRVDGKAVVGRVGQDYDVAKGKAADFVVLSQDLLTVAPERIKDVKVMLTVLAGQNSYRAAGF